jgi:hypothetical protein
MWRNSHFFFPLFFCLLPLLVALAMTVLFMVVPILQAPSVATLTRYARKLLRGRPDASDGELRRIMRARFLPDWATEKGPEVTPSGFFLFGLFAFITPMVIGLRSYFLLEVMESRINRAIEAADRD